MLKKKSNAGYLIKGSTCVCLPALPASVVKRARLIGAEKEEEEEGPSATGTWWGLRSRPRIDDSVTGRGEREPTRVSQPPPPPHPQHQTRRIMLIYGDGWATLSTESGQVHQRIYLFTRLKGAKASATQRLTLRVSLGPELEDLHPDSQKKSFQALLRWPACKFSWQLVG